MKKLIFFFFFTIIAIYPTVVVANTLFSGYLTTAISDPNYGIYGTVPWNDFRIEWNVMVDNSKEFPVHYSYLVTNEYGELLKKDISHFIFQVSDGASNKDFTNFSGGTIAKGDPNIYNSKRMDGYGIPDGKDIYGIKITPFNDNSAKMLIEFDSKRLPMWGDFYIQDGKYDKKVVFAYNLALCGEDPLKKIAVPDTATPVVPIPGGALLASSTLLYMISRIKKKEICKSKN